MLKEVRYIIIVRASHTLLDRVVQMRWINMAVGKCVNVLIRVTLFNLLKYPFNEGINTGVLKMQVQRQNVNGVEKGIIVAVPGHYNEFLF